MPTLFGSKKRSFDGPKSLGVSSSSSSPPRVPIKLVVRGGGSGGGGQPGPTADAAATVPTDKAKAGKVRLDSSSDDSDSNDRGAYATKADAPMPSGKAKRSDGEPPRSPEEIQITIKGAAVVGSSPPPGGSGYGSKAFGNGSKPRLGARRLSQKSSTATLTPEGGPGGGRNEPPPPMPPNAVSSKTAKMLGLDDAGAPPATTQGRQQRGATATTGQAQAQTGRRSPSTGRSHSRNGSSEASSTSVTPTRATFAGGRITPPPPPPSFARSNSVGLSPTSTFNRPDYFPPTSAATTPAQSSSARPGVPTSRSGALPRSSSSKVPIAHRAGVVLDGISPGTEAPAWMSTSTFVSGSIPAPQGGAFAPASAWPLGDGTATTPLGRGIDEQTKAYKKPSAEISPFLFQSEDVSFSVGPRFRMLIE